jgi:hypothetical protein
LYKTYPPVYLLSSTKVCKQESILLASTLPSLFLSTTYRACAEIARSSPTMEGDETQQQQQQQRVEQSDGDDERDQNEIGNHPNGPVERLYEQEDMDDSADTSQVDEEPGAQAVVHQEHNVEDTETATTTLPQLLPAARDHSYLPGNSHPLLVAPSSTSSYIGGTCSGSATTTGVGTTTDPAGGRSSFSSGSRQPPSGIKDDGELDNNSSSNNNHAIRRLPILELPGVVLFPGTTIPIRLVRERALLQYLARQIELCRQTPHLQPQVQLGILTHVVIATPRSTTTTDTDNHGRHRRRPRRGQRQRHEDDGDEDEEPASRPATISRPSEPASSLPPQHRLVSRIGTIATITYTHETAVLDNPTLSDSISNTSHIWQQRRAPPQNQAGGDRNPIRVDEEELVFTAIGTSRFRVVSPVQDESFADLNVFQVEVLPDTVLRLPPVGRLFASSPLDYWYHPPTSFPNATDTTTSINSKERTDGATPPPTLPPSELGSHHPYHPFGVHHDRLVWNLSLLTSVPYCAYRANTWPWMLQGKILAALEEYNRKSPNKFFDATSVAIPDNSNNNNHQAFAVAAAQASSGSPTNHSDDDDDNNSNRALHHLEPTLFSYNLASNLPFTERERLNLLELHSTVERLRIIYNRVLQYSQTEWYLCCQGCHSKLAKVTDVFTFGGAEGATSNYGTL